MASSTIVLIELLMVFGAVIAFGVWQLRSVRRSQAEDRARDAAAQGARSRSGVTHSSQDDDQPT